MEEEKVKGEDTSRGADIEVLKKTFDEAVEKLSIAVGLIKVFSSYDLPTTKLPSGDSVISLTGFETLKASVIISAVDAKLFTNKQLAESKELIEKLQPILDQKIEANDTATAASPAAAAGKMKAKLEIKR